MNDLINRQDTLEKYTNIIPQSKNQRGNCLIKIFLLTKHSHFPGAFASHVTFSDMALLHYDVTSVVFK